MKFNFYPKKKDSTNISGSFIQSSPFPEISKKVSLTNFFLLFISFTGLLILLIIMSEGKARGTSCRIPEIYLLSGFLLLIVAEFYFARKSELFPYLPKAQIIIRSFSYIVLILIAINKIFWNQSSELKSMDLFLNQLIWILIFNAISLIFYKQVSGTAKYLIFGLTFLILIATQTTSLFAYGTSNFNNFFIECSLLLAVILTAFNFHFIYQERVTLERSNEFLLSLLEHDNRGLLLVKRKGELVYYNKTVQKLLGLGETNDTAAFDYIKSLKVINLAKSNDEANNLNNKKSKLYKGFLRPNLLRTQGLNKNGYITLKDLIVQDTIHDPEHIYYLNLPCNKEKIPQHANWDDPVITTKGDSNDPNESLSHYDKKTVSLRLFNLNEGSKTYSSLLKEHCLIVLSDTEVEEKILDHKRGKKLQKNLLHSFSHEVHTALNSSLSNLECALEDSMVTQEFKEKFLSQIHVNLGSLRYFISDVIEYLKMETDEIMLTHEYNDVEEVLKEMTYLIKQRCESKGLALKVTIEALENKFLVTDSQKLRQVLLNLLSNSVKYTFSGEISLTIRESNKNLSNNCLELEIKDTRFEKKSGSNHLLDKILEYEEEKEFRIFMSCQLAKLLGPSSGGGLNVEFIAGEGVKYTFLIERKDNSIHSFSSRAFKLQNKIQSLIFKGSQEQEEESRKQEFSLPSNLNIYSKSNDTIMETVPDEITPFKVIAPHLHKIQNIGRFSSASKLNSSFKNQHFDSPEAHSKRSKPLNALIVDDDPFNILSLELILKRDEINCLKAFNGRQAIDVVLKFYSDKDQAGKKIDFIFMDFNMPEMNGFECSIELNKLMMDSLIPNIPIFGCSANDSLSDVENCIDAGMHGFIAKPLTIMKVKNFLSKFSESL